MRLTQQQIDEMQKKGLKPDQIATLASQKGYEMPDTRSTLQKVTSGVNSVFAGGKIGEALGTQIGYGVTKLKDKINGTNVAESYDRSMPTPMQQFGDFGKSIVQTAGSALPVAGSILGKVGQFGALGAAGNAFGAVADAKSGKEIVKDTAKGGAIGMLTGLTFGVIEKGLSKGTELLNRTGEKIQYNVIKPSQADIKDGFDIETVKQFKLGGSLKDTFAKTDSALDDLGKQLNAKLGAGTKASKAIENHLISASQIIDNTPPDKLAQLGGEAEVVKRTATNIIDGLRGQGLNDVADDIAKIDPASFSSLSDYATAVSKKAQSVATPLDMNKVYEKTVEKLTGNKLSSFGANNQMEGALEKLRGEIVTTVGKNGLTTLPEAQIIKRASGHFGAWQYGQVTPEATASQKVYNAFYNELKTAIEEASPEGVKEINSQMSRLIPVMNAVIRRIPVAERNSAISLTDIITLTGATLEPTTLSLTLINRLSKMGSVGSALTNVKGLGQGIVKGAEQITQSIVPR